MEGPKFPSEARRREVPKRQEGEGQSRGKGAIVPPQYGGLGAMVPDNFFKINAKIAHFCCISAQWQHQRSQGER